MLDRCCEHLKTEGFGGLFFVCVQISCDFKKIVCNCGVSYRNEYVEVLGLLNS